MSNHRIIFIHGYTATSKSDWYPDISKLLIKKKIPYSIPELTSGEFPHAKDWIEQIHMEVLRTHDPVILVGHSLGSRAVLLYLEKYPRKVEKVFLIAAFANDTENAKRNNGAYSDFFSHKIDIKKIRRLSKKFIIIHSKDDSSISYKQGVDLAMDLDAELISVDDRDHLSDAKNAPFIFDILLHEIKSG